METRVMIMAGGTGGHVFPALAVARRLIALDAEVFWMGTRQGLEARVVPAQGIAMEWIEVQGLRGAGWLRWVSAPFKVARAVRQALRIIQSRRPDVVLGMGGFAAGPGGIASWLARIPLVVHEQNAIPGMTNRWLARMAKSVFEAFPSSFSKKHQARVCGNPVRSEILDLPPPETRFAQRAGRARLLILGGSQGARSLNRVLPAALAGMDPQKRPMVIHQAGEKNIDETLECYQAAGVDADVRAFIPDMAETYGWADLVVCRAGALTVFELAAAGVGAILVPFPYAVDDHQTRNARFLVDAGAAIMLSERDLDEIALARVMQPLLADPNKLLEMARNARRLAQPNATDIVARACLEAAL